MDSDALRLGDDAAGILRSDAFQQAVEAVRERIRAEWSQSPFKDVEGREKLWLMSRLLDNLVSNLESFVADGRLAKDNLTQLQAEKPWNLEAFRQWL